MEEFMKYLSKSKVEEVKKMIGSGLDVKLEDVGGNTLITGKDAETAYRRLIKQDDDVFMQNEVKTKEDFRNAGKELYGSALNAGDKESKIRQIVSESQAARVDGKMLDLFTASAIVKVLDALDPERKAKFMALPIERIVETTWKLIK
jgi:hypothetical protein